MTDLLCGLFFGLGGAVCHKTDDKTDGGGADPAETEARKGQNAADRFDDAIEVAGGTQSGGQGAQQVIKGGDQRKADDPVIDLLIVGEELAEQRQQDKHDGQRVEEHQHRNGIIDDGGKTKIGENEGNQREDDRPDPVSGTLGEQAGKGLGAAGDKADGGLEAGKRYGDGEDQQTDPAEEGLRDLRQRYTAVFGCGQYAAALGAHGGDGNIDKPHEQAAEDTGLGGIACYGAGLINAQFPDDLYHDDAEGKACKGVHGVVALQKAGEEGLLDVAAHRLHTGNGNGGGGDQRYHDKDAEEQQEEGIEDLADPCEDLAGAQRKQQRRNKERQREQQEIQLHIAVLGKDLFQPDGEGNGSAAGNSKEWTNGEVQRTGKEIGIGTVYLAAEGKQTITAGKPQSCNTQQRQSNTGNQQSQNGAPHIAAGKLTHCSGEDEVTCAEEQAKQHAGNIDVLFYGQFLFHGVSFVDEEREQKQSVDYTKRPQKLCSCGSLLVETKRIELSTS